MSDFFRADLHCHSTCSDGTLTPKELILHAKEKGLQGLAITDHDTIQAYQEALPFAAEQNFQLLPGVEFSATHRGETVHILGYAFSLDSDSLQAFCAKHHHRRIERFEKILSLLTSLGLPLNHQDIDLSHPSLCRPHVAAAMIKKGYVATIQEAFNKFLAEDKPAYVDGSLFPVEETIEQIHLAGGLAVIAHPHLITRTRVLKDLLGMPFDGIEGYYGRFPKGEQTRFIKIGQERGWIITGGSDFHGSIKPNLPLGSSWVDQPTFDALYHHFKSNEQK